MPHQPLPRGTSIEVLSAPNIFSQPLALPLPLAGSILIVYDLLRHGAFDDTRILPKNALMAWKWSGRQGFFSALQCNGVCFLYIQHVFYQGILLACAIHKDGGVAWILAIQWEYTLQRVLVLSVDVCFLYLL